MYHGLNFLSVCTTWEIESFAVRSCFHTAACRGVLSFAKVGSVSFMVCTNRDKHIRSITRISVSKYVLWRAII